MKNTDEWYLSRYEADYSPDPMPEGGVSILCPRETYDAITNGEYGREGYMWGYEDGVFVAPTVQMDAMLERADGDLDKINEELGVKWDTDSLVQLKLTDEQAESLNIRMPTGEEAGANEDFVYGGKTSGGMDERVIDTFEISEATAIEHEVHQKSESMETKIETEVEIEEDDGITM